MSDPLTQMADALRVTVPKNYDITPIMVAITPTRSGQCYTVIISVKTDEYEIAVEGSGPDLDRACWIAWREFGRRLARALQPKPKQPTREVERWPEDTFTLETLAKSLTGHYDTWMDPHTTGRKPDGRPLLGNSKDDHNNLTRKQLRGELGLEKDNPAA